MADRYLLDTDVLIEYLRGIKSAIKFLEGLEGELILSAITVAELYSGVRDQGEEEALDNFLFAFDVAPVDEDLAREGGLIRKEYHHSHGVGLADALIAATAQIRSAILVTFNRRHYPMLEDLVVPYER